MDTAQLFMNRRRESVFDFGKGKGREGWCLAVKGELVQKVHIAGEEPAAAQGILEP